MIRKLLITYLFLISVHAVCQGQAYFSAPDTICISDSLIITNLSGPASTYYWNFCSGSLEHTPGGENLPSDGTLSEPSFIDFAKDNGQYVAFITNHNNRTITRQIYRDGLLANPSSENMGNLGGKIPYHAQGVQIVQDAGAWYVFVIGNQGTDSRLVRLDFGHSLTNTPTAHNLGNLGELNYPIDLYIEQINGEWIGFTANKNSNSLTRFRFVNGIQNPPEASNLGNNIGLDGPCGLLPIMENDRWYIFVSNYNGHSITRFDFFDDLLNAPNAVPIGNASFMYYPFDLTIIRDCEKTYGFVVNRFNDIVRLEFTNGLDQLPSFTSLGTVGNLYNPHGLSDIFRIGDTLYTYVANIDNSTLTRLYFPGCTNASPASSFQATPPPVQYNAPGTYNINLVINEGQPGQQNYCKTVVVLESPELFLGADTLIPAGTTLELAPDTVYAQYNWSTGSTEASIFVSDGGTYRLEVINMYGCTATDDIEVILDVGIPNFFTPNGDGYNDTWCMPFLQDKPETEIWVLDRFGNSVAHYRLGDGDWDGRSGTQLLPTGTYWYLIKVEGVDKPYKGSVSIKR